MYYERSNNSVGIMKKIVCNFLIVSVLISMCILSKLGVTLNIEYSKGYLYFLVAIVLLSLFIICNVKSKKIKVISATVSVMLLIFVVKSNVFSWFLFDAYKKNYEYNSPYNTKTIVLQEYIKQKTHGIRVYKKINDFILIEDTSYFLQITDDNLDFCIDDNTLIWIDEDHYEIVFWKIDHKAENGYSMYNYEYEI